MNFERRVHVTWEGIYEDYSQCSLLSLPVEVDSFLALYSLSFYISNNYSFVFTSRPLFFWGGGLRAFFFFSFRGRKFSTQTGISYQAYIFLTLTPITIINIILFFDNMVSLWELKKTFFLKKKDARIVTLFESVYIHRTKSHMNFWNDVARKVIVPPAFKIVAFSMCFSGRKKVVLEKPLEMKRKRTGLSCEICFYIWE